MPANPRMGISYSSSCPSMKKYYPSMFFKQHLCECISLRNPLDCSNSSTFWQMGGQLHLPFALLWETRWCSCAQGPELNTDFRSSQQPQAGVAEAVLWIDTLLKQSFLTGTHFWMASDYLVKGSCGCPETQQVFLTGIHCKTPVFMVLIILSKD